MKEGRARGLGMLLCPRDVAMSEVADSISDMKTNVFHVLVVVILVVILVVVGGWLLECGSMRRLFRRGPCDGFRLMVF